MTNAPSKPTSGTRHDHSFVRWAPLLSFGAEALALSAAFDLRTIAVRHSWWAPLTQTGSILPLGLLLVVGLFMTLGEPLMHEMRTQGPARRARWILVTLVAFAATYLLTRRLAQTDESAGHAIEAAWVVSLMLWALSGLNSIVPLRRGLAIVRAYPRSSLAGTTVGVMAFLAGIMLTRSWEVLAPVTLVVVGLTLLALGQKPWLDEGAIVGLGDFSVHIAPVCSGVEGMGLLGAFLLGFLAIFHRDLRLRRALFLVPAALLASFLLNALRIALLLMIGAFGHPDVAVAGFHTKAGWIFFSFLALVFVAIMKSPPFQRDPAPTGPRSGPGRSDDEAPVSARAALLEQSLAPQAPGSTTPYLLPLFVLTLAGLVTEALAVRVDHLYFVRIALGAVCMWWLARSLTELAWSGRSFVYGLVAGVFGLLLWTWMIPLDLERQAEIRSEYEALSPLRAYAEIGVRLLGSALVVPVVEEYAFRGYLMRRLHAPQFDTVRYSDCSWSSLIGSSVVFGVLHGGDWLPATLCGFLFSLAARKANSLHAAVVAHTTTNAAIAAAVLLFGRYDWL